MSEKEFKPGLNTLEGKALAETREDEQTPRDPKAAHTREQAVVAMRLSGASFQAIAEVQEFPSASAARRAFEQTLAATVQDEDIVRGRQLTGMRLERLLQAVWNKAINPKNPEQLAYFKAALSVIDRNAKLFGQDAPSKLAVYTPDAESKEQWIREMMAQLGPEGAAQEADIIDAEVVGDDE